MEKIKIYYEDTDASGRVYYANYLKFLERGRTEFLYKLGLNHSDLKSKFNIIYVVKNCNIDFKKPAFFEDTIIVKTKILNYSKIKIIFSQKIYRSKEILVDAKFTIVSINNLGIIKAMPENILKLF